MRTDMPFFMHCQQTWFPWVRAILVSIALNLMIFGLMPILIQQQAGQPACTSPLNAVNIVRMKKPEIPPRKKTPEKPLPKKHPEKTATLKRPMNTPKPKQPIRNIPFEINARLPALPDMPKAVPMSTTPIETGTPGLRGFFEIGEIDGPLTALTRMPPIYPYRAKRMGIQGWVTVRFIVNESGHTESIQVIKAQPGDIFNENVIKCIAGWRFKPGTIEGVPVKTLVSTTIKFELE